MTTQIFTSLIEAIQSLYKQKVSIVQKQVLSGGDINQAYCLSLSNGDRLFVKMNDANRMDMFKKEAHGLKALANTNTLSTPHVLAIGLEGNQSFLLMEYIEKGIESNQYWKDLGKGLARMHQADVQKVLDHPFGFIEDNYIGTNIQINTPMDSWIQFFIHCRLSPQIDIAKSFCSHKTIQKIKDALPVIEKMLVEPTKPSILHGDLWAGNVYCGNQGKPFILDPAVYIGHREAELAYTQLFGGFPDEFYQAYRNQYPLQAGYEERIDIYNLYHLLNHFNLFGSSYLNSVMAIVERL